MIIFGATYGMASPIPGLDGGTFFILFNVYESFIHAANLRNIRKKLPTVLLFAIGCIAGLFGISRLMILLLNNHEMVMYFCFMGLILGCVPMIYKKSALEIHLRRGVIHGARMHRTRYIVSLPNLVKTAAIFTIALALMLFLAFYGTDPDTYDQLYEVPAGLSLAWVFFASAVGMLVPGVGGALLMIVLGIYTTYIETVANLDIATLLTMATGMVVGILSGIKIVRKILTTYPGELYCAILGFTIGSVFIVFPGFAANLTGLLAIVGMVVFTVIAYLFSKKG